MSMSMELAAAQERATRAGARTAQAEGAAAAQEQRAMEAEARASGLEAARQQVLRHHEEHKDAAFAATEVGAPRSDEGREEGFVPYAGEAEYWCWMAGRWSMRGAMQVHC